MSESESAVGRGNAAEDDCPLCLEPLPPFWDVTRRAKFICCGKEICKVCWDKESEYLDRAAAEGSWGKGEEQLNSICPLCRTQKPTSADCAGEMMKDKFEEGSLPLHLHRALGIFYLEGDEGFEVDVERGMEILMLGAQKGEPNCQYSLGIRYKDGRDGLPKSVEDAKRWLLAATEQGHAKAEYNLAFMLKDEEGNDAEFLRHLSGSSLKGYGEACFYLGKAHYYGECGLQRSEEESIRVLTPAAERGHAESMGLLGFVMCNNPDSWLEPQDNPNFTEGMHWLRRAAAMGVKNAASFLEDLEKAASRSCFMCRRKAPQDHKFLRCSRCRTAWYCSKDCQRRHWKVEEGGHKQFCIKWG